MSPLHYHCRDLIYQTRQVGCNKLHPYKIGKVHFATTMVFDNNNISAKFHALFRSFRHKNYRLFYFGQTISLTGNWLQSTVLGWLVYSITKSSAMLGTVGFVSMVPTLIFGVVAGVFADRWNRQKSLIWVQSLATLLATLLALLTITGIIQIWHIMVIGFIAGIVGTFEMPIRQSFVVELVGHRDLSNAIALNSMMFNFARVAGPALAGVLVGLIGEGYCFGINAISYLFIIYALLKIKTEHVEQVSNREPILLSMKQGIIYAWERPFIRNPLILIFITGFVMMPVMTLMPVSAAEMLKGGPKTLGLLVASVGTGALIAGVHLAGRGFPRGMASIIGSSSVIYGASLILFSISHNVVLSCLILICAGIGVMRQNVGTNTLLQTLVDNEFRGRVMSFYVMTFMGLAPIGSLFWGFLASIIGISWTLTICGLWVIVSSVWFINHIEEMKEGIRHVVKTHPEPRLIEWMNTVV